MEDIKKYSFLPDLWFAGKWTTLDTTFDTIRVRLKQPLTLVLDILVNYFENKRKSGGGDIDSLTIIKGTEMEVEEVLITFSESKGIW